MKINKVNEMSEFPMIKRFTYTPNLTGLIINKLDSEIKELKQIEKKDELGF